MPRPPALLTAATNAGPVKSGPIGAQTIGYSMPSIWQSGGFMARDPRADTAYAVSGVRRHIAAFDELIHRLRRVQHLRGSFAAPNRKHPIEEAELDEQ